MRVAVAGGVPVDICDAPDGRGGAWSASGTIVFSPNSDLPGPRQSVGGRRPGDTGHADRPRARARTRIDGPSFLPDGVHFLFHVRASADERRGVYVARIDRPASCPGSPLFRSESEAVFVPTSGRERGVLLSAADGQLQARPLRRGRAHGSRAIRERCRWPRGEHAVPLGDAERIAGSARDGGDADAVRRADGHRRTERDGRAIVAAPTTGLAAAVAGRAADGAADDRSGPRQSRCLGRGSRRTAACVRVTTATGKDLLPVWSPDGQRLGLRVRHAAESGG